MTPLSRIALVVGSALIVSLPTLAAQGQTGTAQQPGQPPPPSTGVILGQILDAASGRPIPGAIVSLNGGPARPPLAPGQTLSPAEIAAMQAANAPRRIMTDGSGAFVFHSLPKASFNLSASAPGYLSGGYGQGRVNGPGRPIDVDQGERRTGIVLKLWPYASISGMVTDESGDPAVGMSLRLVRVTVTNGQRRLSTNNQVQTDDRGAYRFSGLSPGDYLVALPQTVTSVPSSTVDALNEANRTPNGNGDLSRILQASNAPMPFGGGIRIGDQQFLLSGGMSRPMGPPSQGDNGKTFAYQTTFFPGATTSAEAATISIASGQERSGIDLQLRVSPTVKVSGTVTGPEGAASNMGVKLVPAGQDNASLDNTFDTATTATDGSGAFTFPAVPTGAYVLRVLRVPRPAPPSPPPPPPPPGSAGRGVQIMTPLPPPLPTDPVLWAESPVSVGDADVMGLTVMLRAGSKISGRVVFDGTAPQPTPDMLQRMSISVSTADGRPNVVGNNIGTPGRVNAGGQFATLGYPPGKYSVSANGNLPGWYYKGATLGGRNLDEDPLDIEGADVSGVTITFTDRTTQITGTVHDPAGTRDISVMVFVFPANYAALVDRGTMGRRLRNTTISASGTFGMGGLPPGEYLAVAVNQDNVSDVRDKAFYDSLARAATRVSLADGEKKALDLSVTVIR